MSTKTYQVKTHLQVGSTVSVAVNGQITWGTIIRLHEGGVTINLQDKGTELFVQMVPVFAVR